MAPYQPPFAAPWNDEMCKVDEEKGPCICSKAINENITTQSASFALHKRRVATRSKRLMALHMRCLRAVVDCDARLRKRSTGVLAWNTKV